MKRYRYNGSPLGEREAFSNASEVELRALCVLLAAKEPLSAEELLEGARLESLGDAKDALAFWRGAGLIKAESATKRDKEGQSPAKHAEEGAPEKPKKRPVRREDALPEYSGKELSALIEKNSLPPFIEACQEIYGKVLSATDIGILVALREELHFDGEYICLLLAHYGERAKKPMRYVEKVAFSLYDRGVLTYAQLEEHIEKKQRMRTREGALRRLFGMGERALTSREEEAFLRWCEEYGYDDAMIGLAYDLTVSATGKASVAYADKIISRWNTAGCKTEADAKALIDAERAKKAKAVKKPQSAKEAEKDSMRSFEVDDFFAHALDRSYGKKKTEEK